MALVPIDRQKNVADVAARLRQQIGAASTAQGLKADTAMQPNDLGFLTEDIQSKTISALTTSFTTGGYSEPGKGGAEFARINEPEVVKPWHRQSADGAWWQVAEQVINPAMFGAMRGRSNAVVTGLALQVSIDFCEAVGASLDLLNGNWFSSVGLKMRTVGIHMYGSGTGQWNIKPAAVAGADLSRSAATQIIFIGVGPKELEVIGYSSDQMGGGAFDNKSPTAGHNNAKYSLNTFQQSIASDTDSRARKAMSVGLWLGTEANGALLENFRLMPDGGGDDGLDIYNDKAATAETPWADDWDVGLLVEATNRTRIINVDTVGHWREYGRLTLAGGGLATSNPPNEPYMVLHSGGVSTGFVGAGVRGCDMQYITAVGSTYIEVNWADDHPFDPTARDTFGVTTGSATVASTFTFTSMSKVGDKLRLMTTTNPIAAGVVVGNFIVTRQTGGGTSQNYYDNITLSGIHHPSGLRATDQTLTDPFPHPSKAIEVHGFRVVEVVFSHTCNIQTTEEVAIHFGQCSRCTWAGEIEASTPIGAMIGVRFIANPTRSKNTRTLNGIALSALGVAHATALLSVLNQANGTAIASNVDLRPAMSVSLANLPAFQTVGDNGYFEADAIYAPDYATVADIMNGSILGASPVGDIAGIGRGAYRDFKSMFQYRASTDRLEFLKDILPVGSNGIALSDGTLSIGGAAARLAALYLIRLRMGTDGLCIIQSQTGGVEGAVSSGPGGIVIRTDGNRGTKAYIRAPISATGSGSTEWEHLQTSIAGTTAQRPTGVKIGCQYFDTTLNKPIWFTAVGTWRDASGVIV